MRPPKVARTQDRPQQQEQQPQQQPQQQQRPQQPQQPQPQQPQQQQQPQQRLQPPQQPQSDHQSVLCVDKANSSSHAPATVPALRKRLTRTQNLLVGGAAEAAADAAAAGAAGRLDIAPVEAAQERLLAMVDDCLEDLTAASRRMPGCLDVGRAISDYVSAPAVFQSLRLGLALHARGACRRLLRRVAPPPRYRSAASGLANACARQGP
jgi:hypothetical protein